MPSGAIILYWVMVVQSSTMMPPLSCLSIRMPWSLSCVRLMHTERGNHFQVLSYLMNDYDRQTDRVHGKFSLIQPLRHLLCQFISFADAKAASAKAISRSVLQAPAFSRRVCLAARTRDHPCPRTLISRPLSSDELMQARMPTSLTIPKSRPAATPFWPADDIR